MSSKTKNLGLFKYDTTTDGKQVFSIDKGMNENWDIIDSSTLTHRHITNCITEIPQRINLELTDGVLTLKAGSEVIIPNGFEEDGVTPKFDYTFTPIDLSAVFSDVADGDYMVFVRTTLDTYDFRPLGRQSSGDTASDPQTTAWHYYNTQTNKVDCYLANGGLVQDSFPICVMTMADYKVQSIKQVFNGMGYIGSTIWVDKGVKLLFSNGRNEDGTLNNIEIVVDKVCMRTTNGALTNGVLAVTPYGLANSIIYPVDYNTYTFSEEEPTTARWYRPSTNRFYLKSNGVWSIDNQVHIAFFTKTSTQITSFNPKLPLKAIDYSDKPIISSWSMPSSKYIDLTIGATNTRYTAPANGWVNFEMRMTSGLHQISNVTKNYLGMVQYSTGTNTMTVSCIPVCKGDIFTIIYNNQGSNTANNRLRFMYAEGEV